MTATLKTILIFAALIAAILIASVVYRSTAMPVDGSADPPPAGLQPVETSAVHPEIQLAIQAFDEDREEDAIQHLSSVPPDSEQYPGALQRLAVLLARRGEYPQAIESLFVLSRTRPEDPEVHATLGWVFFLAERYAEAELAALRVFELDSNHLATRYNIGLYRIAQERSQRAIESYIRAMRADVNGGEVIKHRDRLAQFHDEHAESPAAHYALAFFANSLQDRSVEIEELEHFLALKSTGPEVQAAHIKLDEARSAVGGS